MSLEDIDRLGRIIHNLLDISRIESETVMLKKERSNIVSLARKAIASLSSMVKNKGLELREAFAEGQIEVYVDSDRIFEVFSNLVDNAVKFTEKGRIEIAIEEKKGMVECSVSDTGKGIAKEDLKKVFSRFQQFGRTYGPGEKGTGLGLSIVKSIIQLHGGAIRLESKVNKGTKFIFTLPRYTPRELFRPYVDNGIKSASIREEPLSILVYYIKGKKKIAEQQTAPIANRLYELITSSLRRRTDMAVKDARAVLVMLPATKSGDARIIKERIEKPVEKYLSQKGLDKAIKIGCKAAAFPDDGTSADELFDKIKEAVS